MNIRFDDSILQDFGDLCSTFFSSTPMFSIEPFFYAVLSITQKIINAALKAEDICSNVFNFEIRYCKTEQAML